MARSRMMRFWRYVAQNLAVGAAASLHAGLWCFLGVG